MHKQNSNQLPVRIKHDPKLIYEQDIILKTS